MPPSSRSHDETEVLQPKSNNIRLAQGLTYPGQSNETDLTEKLNLNQSRKFTAVTDFHPSYTVLESTCDFLMKTSVTLQTVKGGKSLETEDQGDALDERRSVCKIYTSDLKRGQCVSK